MSDPQPSPADRPARRALALLLAVVCALHLAWAALEPPPRYFEDEPHYSEFAHRDALAGDTALWPGSLRFDQRPELISRLWSRLVPADELAGLERLQAARDVRFRQHVRGDPHLVRSARWIQLPLLLALVLLVVRQAGALGLRAREALCAGALVGLFPWFGFYVHALWAEVLHAALFAAATLAVFVHWRDGTRWPLALGGPAVGVALLAKGTLNSFLPVLVGLLAVVAFLRARGPFARRAGQALLPAALLAGTGFLVVLPQLLANRADGHGFRLAGNRWKNIEMGVVLEPRELQTDAERLDRARLHDLYMGAAPDYEARERLAAERVRAYVAEHGAVAVAGQQLRKLGLLLFRAPSFFERALTERWGDPAPAWLRALRLPGRVLWYLLLLGGVAGALLTWRRSPGFLLLALFGAYYLVAALTIPYKVRFLMPLVPVLAVLCAGLFAVWRERRPPRVPG